MAFLFKNKSKSPQELVRSVRESLVKLQELMGPHCASLAAILGGPSVASSQAQMAAFSGSGANLQQSQAQAPSSAAAAAAGIPPQILAALDRKQIEKVSVR